MTRRIKTITYAGLLFCVANFLVMGCMALDNGSSAFPGGMRDDTGFYVIEHGKRIDFDEQEFWISYYQSLITWVSFPTYIFAMMILHGTNQQRNSNG